MDVVDVLDGVVTKKRQKPYGYPIRLPMLQLSRTLQLSWHEGDAIVDHSWFPSWSFGVDDSLIVRL
jgi:hypothetical protein